MTNYPEHDHQFVVAFWANERIDRIFGPFPTQEEARMWSADFNRRHAPEGAGVLYSRRTIFPVCAALPITQ